MLMATAVTATVLVMPRRYTIHRTPSPIQVDGRLDESAWQAAPAVGDFVFHWWKSGHKEQTVAKLLWDDENVYVGFFCHDKHISGYETKPNGPVYQDDCVEVFVSPNPDRIEHYFNFEMNVLGTLLAQARTDWNQDKSWKPEGVRVATPYSGNAKKDEAPDDQSWTLEIAIPLRHFQRDAAHTPPQDGDLWRLNLNRLGGKTDAQYSSSSPLPPEKISFHQPEWFGVVEFKNKTP
jgi:hypothetical protein